MLDISTNGTQAGTVSFCFLLCVMRLLDSMGWLPLRSVAAACPHTLARGNAPDLATGNLGEPDIAIRPGRNARRSALGCGDMERGEAPAGRDAPDRADIEFRKPEIAI